MMSLKRTARAVLVLALSLGGSACGERDQSSGSEDVVRLFKQPTTIPTFTVTDLSGRTISSDSWQGKVVFVNFWATWCPPCRAEIPDLVALQKKYPDDIVIVGVSEDEGPIESVKEFAATYKVNYPIVMVTPEMRKIFKGIVALPTTFVLDRKGQIVQKHVGQLNPVRTEAEARVLSGLDTTTKVEYVDD